MSVQRPLPAISGQQNLENFLEVLVSPKKYKAQYDALKELAALATRRIEEVVKVKELEGAHKRMLQSEKVAKDTLAAAQKKAQGMIDEAEGVVGALYADFEEAEAAHKVEYEDFRREQATAVEELRRREETAATMRADAETKMSAAEQMHESAAKTKAEYTAKAKAMAALI